MSRPSCQRSSGQGTKSYRPRCSGSESKKDISLGVVLIPAWVINSRICPPRALPATRSHTLGELRMLRELDGRQMSLIIRELTHCHAACPAEILCATKRTGVRRKALKSYLEELRDSGSIMTMVSTVSASPACPFLVLFPALLFFELAFTFYKYSRDVEGRPTMVLRSIAHHPGAIESEDFQRYFLYLLEQVRSSDS